MNVKLVIMIVNFVVFGNSLEKSNETSGAVLKLYKFQTPEVSGIRQAENESVHERLFNVIANGQSKEKKQRPRRGADEVEDYIARELDGDEYFDRKHWTDQHRATDAKIIKGNMKEKFFRHEWTPTTTTPWNIGEFTAKKNYGTSVSEIIRGNLKEIFWPHESMPTKTTPCKIGESKEKKDSSDKSESMIRPEDMKTRKDRLLAKMRQQMLKTIIKQDVAPL